MRINFLYNQHSETPQVCLLRAYRLAAQGGVAVIAVTVLAGSVEAQVTTPPAEKKATESVDKANAHPVSRFAAPDAKESKPARVALGLVAPAVSLLYQGDSKVRTGDMRGAASYYANAALLSPQNLHVRLALGITLAEQGRLDDANFQFRKATELADDDVIAALLLQNTLSERGDAAQAQEILQETYRRFARVGKGGLDATTSINRLRTAVRQDPESPVFQLLLGDACQLSELWDEADTAYRAAIRLAPNWVKPRVNLGLSRLAQGKSDEAIQTLESALSLDPKNLQAQLWKGNAELRVGQNRKALQTFQRVTKVRDIPVAAYSQAMTGIGQAYINTRQSAQALDSLNMAQKISPKDPTPSAMIGDFQLRNGDVNAAVTAYDTALRITRDGGLFAQRAVLYRSLAETLLFAGKTARAQEVLQQAIADEPRQASLWHRLLAQAFLKEGRKEDAGTHLQLALETSTGPYPLETLRAIDAQGLTETFKTEYLKELGLATNGTFSNNTGKVLSLYMARTNVKSSDKRAISLSVLADIARYQNRISEEIRYRKELTTVRDDPWDWFLLAEIYDQRQIEPANARQAYQRALELQSTKGGLTDAAAQWARKRNTALSELNNRPK